MASPAGSTAIPTGPPTSVSGAGVERNPWLVLIVLCGAIFMLLLDTTIVNIAQLKIKEGLGADLPQIQWVIDSYILTYAVFLLSFGRMGDVFGRKKLFILGMAIFTAASALCGASHWLGNLLGVSGVNALIFARVLQGFGGAFMMPQTLSLLVVAFPPQKRGAAMGIWGSVVSLGAIVGPLLGGLIVTRYAWEWVFLINVPVGIIAILATRAVIPESTDPLATKRIDWGGLLLSGFGIFALVYAMIEGNKLGWSTPLIRVLIAGGLILIAMFVWWERRAADPMMKLELFRFRNFWAGNLIATAVAFGMLGVFFPLTLFLQGALGFSPIRAAVTTLPMSLVILVMAPIAGRLTDRIGARWILVTGLIAMTTGVLFIINRISLETTAWTLLPALLLAGFGMSLTFSPMTTAAMAEVPPRIAGSASGILNTMRNVGQVLGIAILGSVLQSRLALYADDRLSSLGLDSTLQANVVTLLRNSAFAAIPATLPPAQQPLVAQILEIGRQAFVDGLHDTFYVSALACLLGAGAALLIRNPARRPAVAPAPRPEPVERLAPAD